MNQTIPVNFHCHSIFSDGDQTPEDLAANLAARGVRYAALTDHDSIEGLQRFEEAARKHGFVSLTGVELTTQFNGREAHLLGFGFDPDNPNLNATLLSIRQSNDLEVQSIAGSLRKIGTNRPIDTNREAGISAAPHGQLDIADAINLIHNAGGLTFLAHPWIYESDPKKLETCIEILQSMGLDGLEAVYSPFTETQQNDLRQLAKKFHLLISAGTDFHITNVHENQEFSVDFSVSDWDRFRKALFVSNNHAINHIGEKISTAPARAESGQHLIKQRHFRRRSYVLRIFLPTFIAISLFLLVIWGYILPTYEQSLLDRKREMIRELTNSAWSILASYEKDEKNGTITLEQAQSLAIAQIQNLRYGPESKDYFWIQDSRPHMIMHPYREDLNGEDLSDFTDPRGVSIFVEFADLVRRKGEGYINYVWQWKDDPERLEPKESYVKGFAPWGWIVGTGIYTDDVNAEIARIEQSLINTSLAISGAVVILLLFVLQQSLRIERERQTVLENLHESTERYHSLIESTTEGTLLITNNRCRYANPTFLRLTGYSNRQLEFLVLEDLLPREVENQSIWDRYEGVNGDQSIEKDVFDGVLKHADGHFLDCVLALNPIVFAGQQGYILLARSIARQAASVENEVVFHAANSIKVGIYRSKSTRNATLIEMNPAAREIMTTPELPQPSLADIFPDATEFERFIRTLQVQGEISNYILHQSMPEARVRILSLSAKLTRDENDQSGFIDGTIEDVTISQKKENQREETINRLQTSLLFLHEPLSSLGRDVVICPMETRVDAAARLMTTRNATALLVSSGNNIIIGIVTDHDLRARVLAENIPPDAPIHTIMSAPLTKIPENAQIYEALMRMEEKGVRHLAVEDGNGQIVNIIDNKSLIQFQRYGPIVLAREVSRASSPAEIAQLTGRVPMLVNTLLESSARPRIVTNMLASICDAATERLVQLAMDEIGPPPVDFVFIAMGSQGRQEQTLLTDQDNGIIYEQNEDSNQDIVNKYFLKLGTFVSDGLNLAGYSYCKGQVMASNPRWCRSLPDWISGFNQWIHNIEPQEIINLSIFLDFRTVYGNNYLSNTLRRAIYASLVTKPPFYYHFAQNALLFKPPFRLLGNIYLGGGATEHAGEINLKDALMPLVSFARLYALQNQINQTHTIDRVNALCERKVISSSSRDEIVTAYDFLMQVRLENQINSIQNNNPPDNIIHPNDLGYIQQELLKQSFAEITAVQKKISYDFPGSV